MTIQANYVADDYIWRWDTRIIDKNNPSQIKADYKQSTFYGTPLSMKQLRKRANDYIPQLSAKAQVDFMVLELMKHAKPLGEIAAEILSYFPEQFKDSKSALTYVGNLSLKYSE